MKKFLFAIALFISNFLLAQRTILHCGKLIDTKNLKVLSEMSIVIEGNKITGIEKGYLDPSASDKVIELKDKTVMPGLIDCHVHLEEQTSPTNFVDQFRLN